MLDNLESSASLLNLTPHNDDDTTPSKPTSSTAQNSAKGKEPGPPEGGLLSKRSGNLQSEKLMKKTHSDTHLDMEMNARPAAPLEQAPSISHTKTDSEVAIPPLLAKKRLAFICGFVVGEGI